MRDAVWMETKIGAASKAFITAAAKLIQYNQVVGMPTETVYGLAANAFSDEAVARIFEAKGRPQDNPLIVHIENADVLGTVARDIPSQAWALAEAFWPGPLTLVLPRAPELAEAVSAGLPTVGVRVPANEAAQHLIRLSGTPLAAPSANRSGSPSPTTAQHVLADMQGRIPFILDDGPCPVGVESTVLSLTKQDGPVILRPGFVTPEDMEAVLGCPVRFAEGIDSSPAAEFIPESPGMKYRHYAPKAHVSLLEGPFEAFARFVEQKACAQKGVFALCFAEEMEMLAVPAISYGPRDDVAAQAAALFAALRALDEQGAQVVYARSPATGGVGAAVRNRLLRAAGFRVISTNDLPESTGEKNL